MTKFSSTYLSHILGGWGSGDDSSFKMLHKHISYQGLKGESHGSTMYLFVILILECEKGTFKAELKEGDDTGNWPEIPAA